MWHNSTQLNFFDRFNTFQHFPKPLCLRNGCLAVLSVETFTSFKIFKLPKTSKIHKFEVSKFGNCDPTQFPNFSETSNVQTVQRIMSILQPSNFNSKNVSAIRLLHTTFGLSRGGVRVFKIKIWGKLVAYLSPASYDLYIVVDCGRKVWRASRSQKNKKATRVCTYIRMCGKWRNH